MPTDHPVERYEFNPFEELGRASYIGTAVLLALLTCNLAKLPAGFIAGISGCWLVAKGLTGSL